MMEISRAPEFKIGLVNDIMCGLIYARDGHDDM